MTAPMADRYVISIRRAGLGDRLICLAAGWRYARDTGRTLVADWRHCRITPDPGENGFQRCFRPTTFLAGVPFIGDEQVTTMHFPKPRYPEGWNRDSVLRRGRRPRSVLHFRPKVDFEAERRFAVDTIRSGRDMPVPTIVFDRCVNDGLVDLTDARTFFSALRPANRICEQVEAFHRTFIADRRIIGLHVRHGNGGDIGTHAPFWNSVDDAISRCERAVHHVRRVVGDDAIVFLTTDSSDVQGRLEAVWPNLLARAKTFRPPGAGELHLGPDAWSGRDDTLVEMLLLARCNALIRYPPGSFFSFYAAAMLSENQPALTTTYDLQIPWDGSDRFAPAVVFGKP